MIAAPSDFYLEALRHTHQARVRVKLYHDGALVGELPVSSVQLTIDGTAEIRRSGSLDLGVDWLDTTSRDIIEQVNVQTSEVTIEHGIDWGPAGTEWVLLARMRIDSLSKSLAAGTRTVAIFDRALLLAEHKFPTVRPLNDTYVNLIETMLHETMPGVSFTVDPAVDDTIEPSDGKSLDLGGERLSEMVRFAEAVEAVFYNTNTGAFALSPYEEDGTPVWDVDAGPGGVLVDLTEEFSREQQYNAVGITFTPAVDGAEWEKYIYLWDNDPTSPTYYDGPFGKRPIFFEEEYRHLPNDTRAEKVARRKLLQYAGATRALQVQAFSNPLLQPNDRIRVIWPDGTIETQIIDAISLSLAPEASMSIQTRLQRTLIT